MTGLRKRSDVLEVPRQRVACGRQRASANPRENKLLAVRAVEQLHRIARSNDLGAQRIETWETVDGPEGEVRKVTKSRTAPDG